MPVQGVPEQIDHCSGVLGLGADAQQVHTQSPQLVQRRQEIVGLGRLGLDAVQREKVGVFAGVQRQAVGVIQTAQLAVVLGQIVVPCREAARRIGQRQPTEGEHFGLHARRALGLHGAQRIGGQFHRQHPASQPDPGEALQSVGVVEVDGRAGDERLAVHETDRAHVVGFHRVTTVGADAPQHAQLRTRLDQGEGRQHHFLAGGGKGVGDLQPVVQTQLPAFAAHRLAQIHHVHRPLRRLPIERQHLIAGPEIQQRSQGQARP